MNRHKTVLLGETIELLNLKEGDVVVDATLGGGGHGRKILEAIGKKGTLIGFDVDASAIRGFESQIPRSESQTDSKFQNSNIEKIGNVYLVNDNFANVENVLGSLDIGKVNAIVADLGWRNEQVEDASYGLSFQTEGPLDMRLGKSRVKSKNLKLLEMDLTAGKIINEWSETELARIFREYGQERWAGLAARAIVSARKEKPIVTTKELSEIINKAIGFRYRTKKISPATKIFQALRIVVNDELGNLEVFLDQSLKILDGGGRLGVISFHSLEDQMVKKFFKTNARGCVCPKEFPVCVCKNKPKIKIITKKPVVPSEEELAANPRSRSAKLRVMEKVGD